MYEKYAKLRDERGYTDYRVSKETGIPSATLTSWKRGIYKPKVDKLMLIARLFCVDITELLDE